MRITSDQTRFGAILFVCWFVSYLERFLINMALPFIGSEYHINEAKLGLLLSVFFAGYALIQLPGGWLSDKFGSRKMIIFSVGMFTLLSAGCGLAWSLTALFVIRFLFGLFEGSYPTAAYKAVSENYSKGDLGRVQSAMLATNPLSLIVAPLMAAPLIAAFGWRGMFLWTSTAGAVAFLLFVFGGKVRTAKAAQPVGRSQEPDLRAVFRDPNIWKVCFINFGVNVLIWGFLSWLPTYMLKVMKLDLMHVGVISTLPGIAGVIGMLAGGWLSDKVFEGREKYLLVTSILGAALSLFVMVNVPTLPVVIVCQTIVAFCVKIAFIAVWALPLKLIDAKNMGVASGIVNLGSQVAGVVAPAIMGYLIVLWHGSYTGAFGFLLGCAVLCAFTAMRVRNTDSSRAHQEGNPAQCLSNERVAEGAQ